MPSKNTSIATTISRSGELEARMGKRLAPPMPPRPIPRQASRVATVATLGLAVAVVRYRNRQADEQHARQMSTYHYLMELAASAGRSA